MSSLISAPNRSVILRGSLATKASPARMDADLRDSPYIVDDFADARLVDPTLAKAFDDAVERARAQARDEGFAQGYRDGLAAAEREKAAALDRELAALETAEAERQQQLRRTLSVLDAAATEYATRQASALHDVEDFVLNAAFDLATTLLGRELEIADAPVRDAVRRALAVLPGDVPVTLVVHPLDLAALADVGALAEGHSVRLVSDLDVEPGSCIADGGATHVDASLSAAIERVRQVLSR
jgi:flagellar assembly protein FliH